ncbi:3-hxdroxyacyl-CoA dehydrogenase [Lujinxingia litoralis]|uniref:3-hxdroxyacyl-CoA dehydrogenase n=1 Tax=Lujinxingia litoralis TaxID=2211119 RepID=A0A328C8B4_9DELT|nr:enoyl-CoA hydratase-related protein [Lujinxingia litoralis]RAL23078.1 3-hxdroxyacyl-CoA dehydrogenase [Lujinxingia litoralis]
MSDVLYTLDGPIARITLNRPDARNAFSDAMIKGITDSLDQAERDPDVRVVIVTGQGSAFCAGGDLKAMRDHSGMFGGDPVELRQRYLRGMQTLPRRFDSFEKPTIAQINGPAIGAGLGLALMCDLRVSARRAKFGSTFARVGLIPGDGGAYLLTRTVGFSRALELILTARVIGADDALKIEMVHEVVPDDELAARTLALASEIAALPPKAVSMAKTALYRSVNRDLESALHITAALQGLIQSTQEHEDAVEALLNSLHSN